MNDKPAMIQVSHLSKAYGGFRAVDDVSFNIANGEIVGLLGLNGAGKTTLLRMLACLLSPSEGRASLGGMEVQAQPLEVRRQIGFLPEVPPLYGDMRVRDFLRLVAGLRAVPGAQVADAVDTALQRCQLHEVAEQRIETLSFGFRKRVGIAQAIVHSPPIVLLDEPIAGLDPAQIVEMRSLIQGLAGAHTLLLSSHILGEISQTCDRILVMHQGRLAAQGTEKELVGRFVDGSRLRLDVAGGEQVLRRSLQELGEDLELEWLEPGDDFFRLRLQTNEDRRAEVARVLVKANLDLLRLEIAGGDLESVFLQLTGNPEARS